MVACHVWTEADTAPEPRQHASSNVILFSSMSANSFCFIFFFYFKCGNTIKSENNTLCFATVIVISFSFVPPKRAQQFAIHGSPHFSTSSCSCYFWHCCRCFFFFFFTYDFLSCTVSLINVQWTDRSVATWNGCVEKLLLIKRR